MPAVSKSKKRSIQAYNKSASVRAEAKKIKTDLLQQQVIYFIDDEDEGEEHLASDSSETSESESDSDNDAEI